MSTPIRGRNYFNLKKSLCIQWGMVIVWQVGTRSDYRAGEALWCDVPCRFQGAESGLPSPALVGGGPHWKALSVCDEGRGCPPPSLCSDSDGYKMLAWYGQGSLCFLPIPEEWCQAHRRPTVWCGLAQAPSTLRSWACWEGGDRGFCITPCGGQSLMDFSDLYFLVLKPLCNSLPLSGHWT